MAVVGTLLLAAACTEAPGPIADTAPTSVAPSPTPVPAQTETPERSATPKPAPPPHPVSVPSLFEKEYDGRGLRLGQVLVRTDAYTQYTVTYRSGPLRVSGILNVPDGRGPFPALVLAHGYIDPAVYTNGQGMRREQDWLARAGFVVLHTDYRNHGYSDPEPRADERLRLGYAEDVINAVHALRRTSAVPVADDRIGLVGRSMGGGVVYNALVAQPRLVDAGVVFAPVSSLAADNFDRWVRRDPGRDGLASTIMRRYGAPEDAPEFWADASPRPYFDRITEPVLIHHGTADESCPIRWSRATHRELLAAGVDSTLRVYEGEPHAFVAQWPLSMRRTVDFLRAHLR